MKWSNAEEKEGEMDRERERERVENKRESVSNRRAQWAIAHPHTFSFITN